LLERFGSARGVLQARADELQRVPHIGAKLADDLSRIMRTVDVPAEVERMARHNVHLLVLGSPAYPASLATIADPPHLLYIRGGLEPGDIRAVALVGSRYCTPYGRRVAEHLARGLARAGVVVISGLARGIDSCAHRGALQGGGRTLAVLAGGLSRIYPPEHKDLAEEVVAAGALVSEASMEMEPMAGMFPARNRIISGLARGVVIIEAAEKSGALITASHAGEQGRTVFAVPGPIDCTTSAGTNTLLRQGAILVRSADDILEELDGLAAVQSRAASPPPAAATPPGLDDVQRQIWDFLAGQPRHLDEMAQQLGFKVPQLSTALMTLEMKRVVRRLPGNRYERT
jgi:DNA processing protein